MKRRNMVVAALSTGAIAAGAGVAMTADGATGTAASTDIALTAKATGGAGLDLGKKGVSPGDQFLEHGRLKNAAGQAAGRFQMVTQLVSGTASHGSEQSSFTLDLPAGEVEAIGGHGTTSRYKLPVVGGTGDYAGAGGTLTVAPGTGGTERVTLTLR
jgi:hypothetical protein